MTNNKLITIMLGCFMLISSGIVFASEVEDFVEFRDSLKPGSSEASGNSYQTIAWAENERDFVLKSIQRMHSLAPALLPRGASDGTISLYRAKLRNYAKGGPQRLLLDEKVFLYQDYSSRVVLHELVHTADGYSRFSSSDEFRQIFEPKIRRAQALLKQEGLTPATAAALPIGERRKKIELAVKKETGLPSAYASRNLTECLAEVVSSWLFSEYRYSPGPEAIALLTQFVSKTVPPHPADIAYRAGEALFSSGKTREAIEQWSNAIELDSGFYQAYSSRGFAYERLNKLELAVKDLKQSRDLVPPFQFAFEFYDSQWKRVSKLAQ